MFKQTNMLDTIKDLGSKLNSYSDSSSTEDRTRVLNRVTGEQGIVVSTEGDKLTVKWVLTGSMEEYTKKQLDNVNSDVCYAERLLSSPIVTVIVQH